MSPLLCPRQSALCRIGEESYKAPSVNIDEPDPAAIPLIPHPMAIDTAQHLDIAGHRVRIVTPALFIATKLEAFHGRGGKAHPYEDWVEERLFGEMDCSGLKSAAGLKNATPASSSVN
jgi:hypothetical protein